MEVSNSFNRYDSAIQPSSSSQEARQINKTGTIKQFLQAFKIDLSERALASSEYNDPTIKFPTHNPDVLQYSENLNLILKP